MKNKEKYAEDIIALAICGFNIACYKKTKELVACETLDCEKCMFNSDGNCTAIRKSWFESEAEQTEADKAAEIARLTAENAKLRARLDKAVELPYERKRLLWGDKDKETLLCPDCLTDIMGGIGDETFVVQCPTCGCFVDCTTEPVEFSKEAEARLKELQGGER